MLLLNVAAFSYSKIIIYKEDINMPKDNNGSIEPNEMTYETMETMKNNEDIYGPFDSIEELMEALNS